MPSVLDACAMIAYLRGEPGAAVVKDHIAAPGCFAHGVNLCEVAYKFSLAANEQTAEEALLDLGRVGVHPREDLDLEFRRAACRSKVRYPQLSLADCLALALAQRLRAAVVTSDRAFRHATQEVEVVLIR